MYTQACMTVNGNTNELTAEDHPLNDSIEYYAI